MVSPQFRPIVGGYERAAERLSVGLAQKGHQVLVISERRDPAWPAHETHNGVHVRRWWCQYRRGIHTLTSVIGLLLTLLWIGRRYQIWHVHQYGVHAAVVISLGIIMRRPAVLKLTSSGYGGLASVGRSGQFPSMIARIHRRAAAVVAMTRETRQEALEFGVPEHRVHVIGNPVDIRLYTPASGDSRTHARARLDLPDHPTFVAVSGLRREKRIDVLLRAWANAIPLMSSDASLVIVGAGSEQDSLHALAASLELKRGVRFVGHQSDVQQWLTAADVFVQVSDREGLSNTMLEAMATGLPVIVTRVSGTSECVVEPRTGLCVDIGDVTGLAEAIVVLSRDANLREEMGARARQVVLDRYSTDCVCEAYRMLYKDLSSGTPGQLSRAMWPRCSAHQTRIDQ